MGNLGSATDILYFNKVMSSTMHWPYLGVIIVQKIPSESLQYNSTTVFMTCNEMAATVSCRHGSHTQVSTLPYPPTGQSPCISMCNTYTFIFMTQNFHFLRFIANIFFIYENSITLKLCHVWQV